MIRPPPTSTLFPYTPLSRSLARFGFAEGHAAPPSGLGFRMIAPTRPRRKGPESCSHNALMTEMPKSRFSERSEEHTSELQSPCNLVCRLLLEKKKKYILQYTFNCTQPQSIRALNFLSARIT